MSKPLKQFLSESADLGTLATLGGILVGGGTALSMGALYSVHRWAESLGPSQEARDEYAKKSQRIAWETGYRGTKYTGHRQKDNPYHPRSLSHDAWDAGHRQAKKEELES